MNGDVLFWLLVAGAVCFLGYLAYEEFFPGDEQDDNPNKEGTES